MSERRKLKPTQVRLPLGKRSYDIVIGSGAIRGLGKKLKIKGQKRAFLLSDQALVEARAATISALESAGWEVSELPVRAGESLKEIDSVYPIYGELLKSKANRDTVLFALGGGTIGDAAGFVAATYMRGISWVGIPTTLLAQVDSSVGGKTGINHSVGKNLIGAFHQPSLVLCDLDFLATLSRREMISGFGEIIKYGLIYDLKFLVTLERDLELLLQGDLRTLQHAVEKSVQWKCKAVARDELDRKGVREALNFGHTFGHALESITRYETFQHGEAVIWGMRFALALSFVRRKLAKKTWQQLDALLSRLDVPPLPAGFSADQFISKMKQDKKVRNGKIHFVLLKRAGQSVSDSSVSEANLKEAYRLMTGNGGSRDAG